jgi:hypothetical protein
MTPPIYSQVSAFGVVKGESKSIKRFWKNRIYFLV